MLFCEIEKGFAEKLLFMAHCLLYNKVYLPEELLFVF